MQRKGPKTYNHFFRDTPAEDHADAVASGTPEAAELEERAEDHAAAAASGTLDAPKLEERRKEWLKKYVVDGWMLTPPPKPRSPRFPERPKLNLIGSGSEIRVNEADGTVKKYKCDDENPREGSFGTVCKTFKVSDCSRPSTSYGTDTWDCKNTGEEREEESMTGALLLSLRG
eukprot:g7902.t1